MSDMKEDVAGNAKKGSKDAKEDSTAKKWMTKLKR